ncbi:reverse transcriptase domain-containing protein [Tanacetum coccineum]
MDGLHVRLNILRLTDFLIEVPLEDNKKEVEEKGDTKPTQSSDGSGTGLMLIDPEGKEYTYALRFGFETTNNEEEYEALLAGLRISQKMEITSLAISVDSQLLVNQIKGTYASKQSMIREYLQKTKEALNGFDSYTIEHIRRNQNKKADALSKLALMTFKHLTKEVLVEVLPKRSIEEKEILQVETKEGESWMTPIHEYLVSGLLPEDPKEARKIRTDDTVKEVHKGSCGFNTEPRSMVVRITKQGYYWPSMHRDAIKVLQDCEKCKEQSAIRKGVESSAITAGGSKTFDHYKRKACRKIRVGIHSVQIRSVTNNQLKRQEVFPRRTLLRNSQKETPFSLTYGSEAIIPIFENDVAKDDRGKIKEVDKRRGNKEIASIEEAYYRSKLHKHHNERSNHSIYKIGDFILLSQNNTRSTHIWQGPHMSYTSPKLLIGGNPQEGTWWHCKKHTGKRKFALKGLKKKHNGSDTWNATLAIRVLTKVIQRLKIEIQ